MVFYSCFHLLYTLAQSSLSLDILVAKLWRKIEKDS